jgi:hypothetical protein
MLKDTEDTLIEDDVTGDEAREIYCATYVHLVTRTDWRMIFDGAHEHTLFNLGENCSGFSASRKRWELRRWVCHASRLALRGWGCLLWSGEAGIDDD